MADYRLTELAALSGVSPRNIRAYRERGLLDPPRRQGRSAFYQDHHLSQLGVINELLRKGFTTVHIAGFFSSARDGHDLAGLLGVPLAVSEPTPDDLAVDPGSDEVGELVQYGLAEVIDGQVRLVNPDIAEVVGHADDQMAYLRTILRVADGIADALDRIARAVVEALEDSLADGVADGRDTGRVLRRVITDYRALGSHVVADRLEDALQRRLVGTGSDSYVRIGTDGAWTTGEL